MDQRTCNIQLNGMYGDLVSFGEAIRWSIVINVIWDARDERVSGSGGVEMQYAWWVYWCDNTQ